MSQYHAKQLSIEEVMNSGFKFEIPEYQRGYRWGCTEVEDLLNDLNELSLPENIYDVFSAVKEPEKYCLQPIVFDVSREGQKNLIVVDGQQRLTTLFLIASFISKKLKQDAEKIEEHLLENEVPEDLIRPTLESFSKLYDIHYSNEQREKIFQDTVNNLERVNKQTIESFYISSAYACICEWCKKNKIVNDRNSVNSKVFLRFVLKFYRVLSIIWYELDENTDGTPSDYFSKINSGKIALTNSELIKANLMLDEYCLKNDNEIFADEKDEVLRAQKEKSFREIKKERLTYERIKMSRQWDEIEWQLRNEEFWRFISEGSDKYNETRIDFLFDLLAKKYYETIKESQDYNEFVSLNKERATFIIFARYLKKMQTADNENPISLVVWKEIWSYYMIFREWFNDRKLYHYVGYIITANKDFGAEKILDYIQSSSCSTKKDVENILINHIKGLVNFPKGKINSKNAEIKQEYKNLVLKLDFSKDKALMNRILLLFNVISVLNDRCETSILSRDTFFPFGRCNVESWNLEHIHSQADGFYTKGVAQKYIEYLEKMLSLLKDKKSDDYNALENGLEVFKKELAARGDSSDAYIYAVHECATKVEKAFSADLELTNIGKIGNMAMLDERTNKSYHNVPFFMKRLVIKDVVNGKVPGVSRFVPLCTRNVFDKSYSKVLGNTLHWTNSDCSDYADQIIDTIFEFFEGAEKNV